MKLKTFVELLKDHKVDFNSVRIMAGKDLKDEALLEDPVKFLRKVKRLPKYVITNFMNEFENAITKHDKKWETPEKLIGAELETLLDITNIAEERIKITTDNYKEYFDSIISDEESDMKSVYLNMELFSVDKGESFKAKLLSSSRVDEIHREIATWLPVAILDYNFLCVLQYIIYTDKADSSDISVAEAVSRGKFFMIAAGVIGAFVEKKFTDLCKDFF